MIDDDSILPRVINAVIDPTVTHRTLSLSTVMTADVKQLEEQATSLRRLAFVGVSVSTVTSLLNPIFLYFIALFSFPSSIWITVYLQRLFTAIFHDFNVVLSN